MTTNENILPIDGDTKPLDKPASGAEITPLDNHASGIVIKPVDPAPAVPDEEIQTMDNHASTPLP
ncbi:hypothetical protein [Streptomyces sp. NPDC002990]